MEINEKNKKKEQQALIIRKYQQYLKLEKEGAPFEELEKMTLGALRKAVVDGDTVYGSVMAGQSAGLVKKEETCKEIIEDVVGLNK